MSRLCKPWPESSRLNGNPLSVGPCLKDKVAGGPGQKLTGHLDPNKKGVEMNAWDDDPDMCRICDKPAAAVRSVPVWRRDGGYVYDGQELVLLCSYHVWLTQTYEAELVNGEFRFFTDLCDCGESMEYFVYFLDGRRWTLHTSAPQCLLTARARAKSFRRLGMPAIVTRNGSRR